MRIFSKIRQQQREVCDLTEEEQSAREIAQTRRAWLFIYDAEPPENFDRGVRALLLQGVPATRIIGAMTIAAMKPNIPDTDQWVYLCGVIRGEQARSAVA